MAVRLFQLAFGITPAASDGVSGVPVPTKFKLIAPGALLTFKVTGTLF